MARPLFRLACERAPEHIGMLTLGFVGLFAALAVRFVAFGLDPAEPRLEGEGHDLLCRCRAH